MFTRQSSVVIQLKTVHLYLILFSSFEHVRTYDGDVGPIDC